MNVARRLIVIVGFVLVTGCGSSTDAPIRITGSWSGTIVGAGSANLTLVEDQSGGITGSGNLVGGASVAITITGTHANPSVSMIFAATGFSSSNFSGKVVTATQMRGAMQGSGFTGDSLVLNKTP